MATMMNSAVQTTSSGAVAPQLSASPPVTSNQQLIHSGHQPQMTASNRGGVQIQVLTGNSLQQQQQAAPTTLNEGVTTTNSSSDLLSQLGSIRLPPEQQQQLLLAAQIQHLRSSNVVLQPALQSVTLLPATSVPQAPVTSATTSSAG